MLLDTIVARKHDEVRRLKARLPLDMLLNTLLNKAQQEAWPVRSFKQALCTGDAPRVIAEIKRASPSGGVLQPKAPIDAWRPEDVAKAYQAGGAAALSVLTDTVFFWGDADALMACRDATSLPVLRKDFVVDPYQVAHSRFLGADAVLLIVRILDDATLHACAAQAKALGMDVLVETHTPEELERAVAVEDAIIGVNSRDLDTLEIDLQRPAQMAGQVPKGRIMVGESGIRTSQDVAMWQAAGIDNFLVGEHLIRSGEPQNALQALIAGG